MISGSTATALKIIMKSIRHTIIILFVSLPAFAAWDSPENGNPLLPGYTADPSILFDSSSATFYVYSTSDGVWIPYSAGPQVACSKDFINWEFKPLALPSFRPAPCRVKERLQ